MFGLFRNKADDAVTARLYEAILQAARRPVLFLDYAVPDTVEGRYDMMVLHLFVLMQRLQSGSAEAKAVGQKVCDRFFTEMDRAMREMGVGDLTVPKKMTKIAHLYAGCSQAYATAMAEAGDAGLAGALMRNVYENAQGKSAEAQALSLYTRAAAAALAAAPEDGILAGALPFPDPAGFFASSP